VLRLLQRGSDVFVSLYKIVFNLLSASVPWTVMITQVKMYIGYTSGSLRRPTQLNMHTMNRHPLISAHYEHPPVTGGASQSRFHR
jgi:hypothetical protein